MVSGSVDSWSVDSTAASLPVSARGSATASGAVSGSGSGAGSGSGSGGWGLEGRAKGSGRDPRPPPPERSSSKRRPRPPPSFPPPSRRPPRAPWERCCSTSSPSWPSSSIWPRVRTAKPSTATVERRLKASWSARAERISLSLRRMRKPPPSRFPPDGRPPRLPPRPPSPRKPSRPPSP